MIDSKTNTNPNVILSRIEQGHNERSSNVCRDDKQLCHNFSIVSLRRRCVEMIKTIRDFTYTIYKEME